MAITYNGHTFSKLATYNCKVEPVYNAQRQTVIYHKITLYVNDYIAPENGGCNNGSEETMNALRHTLLTARRSLKIEDIGFDTINLYVVDQDITGGPRPLSLEWHPIGGKRTGYISWSIEFTVTPCNPASPEHHGLVSLSIQHSIDFNERGYQTCTTKGVIEVSKSASPDIYNNYRSKIHKSPMINGHRTQSFSVSEDGCRMTITIRDVEIESPNAYPPGVVDIQERSTLRVRRPSNWRRRGAATNVSCEIILQGDAPRRRAWDIWNAILEHRLGRFEIANHQYQLYDMKVSEGLYDNRYSFSVDVTTTKVNLNDCLNLFSFFATQNQDWQVWSNSMFSTQRDTGLSNKGLPWSGLVAGDRNLCNQSSFDYPTPTNSPFPPLTAMAVLCGQLPPPEKSWTEFEAHFEECPDIQSAYYTTYGEGKSEMGEFNKASTGPKQSTFKFDPVGEGYNLHITKAPGVHRFIWRGNAQRIGYPIPPPTKVTLDGKQLRLVGEPKIDNECVGKQFCLDVYEASWVIGLVLDSKNTPDYSSNSNDIAGVIEDGRYDPPEEPA